MRDYRQTRLADLLLPLLLLPLLLLGLLIPTPAPAQETRLFGGGEWDFESGFYFATINQDGRSQYVGVGNGWSTVVILEEYGVPAFNENQNPANLTSGVRSQEISMTFRDGKGWLFRTVNVPSNHRIRFEADIKAEYGETPPIPSVLVDPTGGTSPTGPNVMKWLHPEIPDPEPGTPLGVFQRVEHEAVVPGGRVTLFLGVERDVAGPGSATFMVDNVEIWDLGPAATPTPTATPVPTPSPTPTPGAHGANWLIY